MSDRGVAVAQRVLSETDWLARQREHVARVEGFLAPHLLRARRGEAHPVWDFLFTYYSLRPRQLRRWHPGFGVVLAGSAAARYAEFTGYESVDAGVAVSDEYLAARVETVDFVVTLLRATAARPARMNCFGLHEWAMVYRSHDVRHGAVPLRLGGAGTDAVVESMPLRCSHFDAFRFFTGPAAELNTERLTRSDQVHTEQPGCIHAAMDLYKWAYKLGPLVRSDLLVDCLALAFEARAIDMRASPYDLAGYGFDPIAVETPAGRATYVRAQQEIGDRAAPLRAALADACDHLLSAVHGD